METALLKVKNDILMSMDEQHVTLLVLLDLSAAFGTIHHDKQIVTTDRRQFILFYLFYFSPFFVFICISAFWFALLVT